MVWFTNLDGSFFCSASFIFAGQLRKFTEEHEWVDLPDNSNIGTSAIVETTLRWQWLAPFLS